MGKGYVLAVVTALVGILGLGQGAEAGVTYDFAFRSTDINGNPLDGFVVGGGRTFAFSVGGFFACDPGSGAGCAVLDVLLRTTDPLFLASVSVVFDDSTGLGVTFAQEWFGQGILFNMTGAPIELFAPLFGLSCVGMACSSFNGVVIPPNAPPSLPVGTYNIGTIVWDTSGMFIGANPSVMTQVIDGQDATGAVVNGVHTDVTGTAVTEMGFIYVIPEPATAGLLGLGLAGLVLVGLCRRTRSRP